MIHTTLGDIRADKVEATLDHNLYLIKDGETVIYVGKSEGYRGVLSRVKYPSWGPTAILIAYNHPASLTWQVVLLTLDDCDELINNPIGHTYYQQSSGIMEAERDLIMHLHPCVNKVHNPRPTSLPAQYCPPPGHPFWRRMSSLYFEQVINDILAIAMPEAFSLETEYITRAEMLTIINYITEKNSEYQQMRHAK
jgi:hypothetical protein